MQSAEALLGELQSAASRARLDLGRAELVSKVEADKLRLAVADAEAKVKAQQLRLEGEQRATAADISIVRQKRDKAAFDVADAQRTIASLSMRSPTAGQISLMPNFRGSGPGRTAPEFKRGDRAWFGAPIAELPDLTTIRMTCRVDEADRARVPPDAGVRVRVDAIPDREFPGKHLSDLDRREARLHHLSTHAQLRRQRGDERLGRAHPVGHECHGDDRTGSVAGRHRRAGYGRVFANGVTLAYVIDGRSVTPRVVTVARRSRDRVAISGGVRAGERIALRDPTIEGPK